ncbi:MAG: Crp/Fnr family transcriptional regulator [Chloroflexi bacterium]|nr:Crp/Fnr family transcriptional regulator [Chloroflexota bacterium]
MHRLLPWRPRDSRHSATAAALPVGAYLEQVDVFKRLTPDELDQIGKSFAMWECPRGTLFFTPDDPTERLFILKRGLVEVYRLTPSGKRLVTRRIEPVTLFGEMGLLGQTMHDCFAAALEDSLVCVGTRDDILRLSRQYPDVALRMLEVVGERLKALEERLELVALNPVRVRLASFLLANADPGTGLLGGYTHEEIGEFIGALRQTVTEALSAMQAQRVVEVRHRSIRIRDRAMLERLVIGDDAVTGTGF